MADPQDDPIEQAFAAAKATVPDPIEDAFRAAKVSAVPFTGPIQPPEEPDTLSAHGITDPNSVHVTEVGALTPKRDLPNPVEGVKQFGRGFYGLGSAIGAPHAGSASEAMRAGSDMIEGIFQMAAPLVGAAATEAPLGTAWGLLKAYVAGKAGTKAAEALTDNPDAHRFAGDLAATISGGKSADEFIQGNVLRAADVMAAAGKAVGKVGQTAARTVALAGKLSGQVGSGATYGSAAGVRLESPFTEELGGLTGEPGQVHELATEAADRLRATPEAEAPPPARQPPVQAREAPTTVEAAYEQAKRVTEMRGGRTAGQVEAIPSGPTALVQQDKEGRPIPPTVAIPAPPVDLQPAEQAASIGHPYQASTEAVQALQEQAPPAEASALPRGVSESEPVQAPAEDPWTVRQRAIADSVKQSKASGAVHLDQLPLGVEALRGRRFKSLRDGQDYIATTVDNRGTVYFITPDGKPDEAGGDELGELVLQPSRLADLSAAIEANTGKKPSKARLAESAARYGFTEARPAQTPTTPAAPEAPKFSYEDFSKQYRSAFQQASKYTPDQIGSRLHTDAMARLADAHPDHLTRLEAEEGAKATAAYEAAKGVESPHGEAPASAPSRPRGGNRETPASPGAEQPAGGDTGVSRPRFPPPALDELFVKSKPGTHAHRFTPDVTRELERIAEELSTFPFVDRHWDYSPTDQHGKTGNAAGGNANIIAGNAGAEVDHDIIAYAPVNKVTSGKRKGQPGRQASGTRDQILHAVRRLIASQHPSSGLMEGALRVAERRAGGDYSIISTPSLPPHWGTVATPEDVAIVEDVLAHPDEWEEALHKLQDEEGDVDFDPDTLEAQRRLPEAGAVREQEHATPQFEAPFSLTGEAEQREAVEPDLFGDERPKFSARTEPAPIFYSALTRAAEGLKQNRGTPEQMAAMLEKAPGIKRDELDWSGVLPWIKGQQKFVTKADIVDYLRKNELQVTETLRGGETVTGDAVPDGAGGLVRPTVGKPTKFGAHTLPGGEHYRELLITLPVNKPDFDPALVRIERHTRSATQGHYALWYGDRSLGSGYDLGRNGWHDAPGLMTDAEIVDMVRKRYDSTGEWNKTPLYEGVGYTSGHFDEPNVLAHVRFNDRTDVEGKRILFIEEIQSDWHQKGRKHGYQSAVAVPEVLFDDLSVDEGEHSWTLHTPDGRSVEVGKGTVSDEGEAKIYAQRYFNNRARERNAQAKLSGVPDAPFKTTWQELAARRMVRYAAEHGYDRIAWTTGEQQAERYDLSKQIAKVRFTDANSGGIGLPNMDAPTEDGTLTAYAHGGKEVINQFVKARDLADYVGKDVAEKLLAAPPRSGTSRGGTGARIRELSRLDLKVGGEGMKGFYDQILPAYLNKFGKPFGARVGETRITVEPHVASLEEYARRIGFSEGEIPQSIRDAYKDSVALHAAPVHMLPITDPMRQTALEGLPLFADHAPVTPRGIRSTDRDLLVRTYRDMPSVQIGDRSVAVLDAGSRFTPDEIAALADNPAVQKLATASLDVLDAVLDRVVGTDRSGVERTGLLLMQDIFGVYVPKPGSARGKNQRATILLNPFEAMIGPRQSVIAPAEAAKVAYYTAVHEALHWHVPFDGPKFDAQLHALLEQLGDEFRDTSTARIMETYADPDQPRQYRAGILDLLRTYQGTRRRPATAADALSDAFSGGTRFSDRTERQGPAAGDLRQGRQRTVTEQQLRTLAERAGTSVAQQRAEAEKRGYTVYSTVLPGAEKLEPAVEKIAQALRNDTALVLSIFGPAHVGVAPMAAGSARAYTAARDQQLLRVQKELAATKRVMDSWSKEKVKLFWRVMEGQEPPQSLPRSDRQYAQTLGAVLKRWTDLIVELGLIEDYLEHYFPHEWVKGSVEGDLLRKLFGRRPMQGSEAFRKRRSIPTMEEGLKLGLEPVSWNPADQVFRKVAEMAQSVRARGFKDDMVRKGIYAYVPVEKANRGSLPDAIKNWDRVPEEALGVVYGRRVPEQTFGRVTAGYYYAPPEVVRLVKNMISRGLAGRSVLMDGFNQAGNASTAMLLGWTARHVWLTGLEWAVSKFSLGIEEAGRGEIGEAAKSFAQVLGPQAAVFIARDIVKGYKDIKEFYGRDATANATAGFVGQVIQGGGGFGRPLFDQTDAPRKFATNIRRLFGALRDGEIKEAAKAGSKAAIFGALTVAEGPTILAMEYWVPALKASAFHDLAEMELRRLGPDATLEDQRKVYGKAWDSVDNRFGQLRYDNLFWNNTFKQILMSLFLSVSWQVGSLREGGGALGQIPLTARKLKAAIEGGGGEPPRLGEEPPKPVGKGKTPAAAEAYVEPWVNRQFAWMIALMTLVVTADAIKQYLSTGLRLGEDKDGKTDWKLALRDAFAPRNGKIGPSGREERDTPISYAKDFYSWTHHPVTTTEHKLKSIWHLLADLAENEDFYGDAIYDGNDPLGTIAKDAILYALKGSLPISYQHAKQRLSEGVKFKDVLKEMAVEGASPFEPASAELERSDLEQYLHDLIPPSHRTKADAAKAAARRTMREQIRQGDTGGAHQTATEAGLSRRSEQAVRRSERVGSLVSAFDRVTWPEAVKAMDLATDTERASLRGPFLRKALNALKATRSSEERARIQQQRNAALKQPQPTM